MCFLGCGILLKDYKEGCRSTMVTTTHFVHHLLFLRIAIDLLKNIMNTNIIAKFFVFIIWIYNFYSIVITPKQKFHHLLPIVSFFLLVVLALYWWQMSPLGIEGKIYQIGASVCHQIPSHSFFIAEKPFPLCSRCTGMYGGVFIATMYFFLRKRRATIPAIQVLAVFGFFALAWIFDGLNSLINDLQNSAFIYTTTNTLRLFTGLGMGLTIATTTLTLWNITMWKEKDSQSPPVSLSDVGFLLLSSFLFTLPILTNATWIMELYKYIVTLTIILLITTLYAIVWTLILRRENQAKNCKSLIPQITIGLLSALAQIILLNFIKLWLYG